MRDIINATLGQDHFLKCSTYSIARNGEGLTPCLSISIPENLCKYWAYIDFKKADGETFKTPRIDVVDGKIEYNIPLAVLDVEGKLEVQIIFQNENSEIWKSYVKEFTVRYSINATDDIPDKQDFISEAQALLDEISGAGGGGGGSITVDQTYTPESENAQSGKAVAQAVATKTDKFADVTIEKQNDKIKKVLLDVIRNTKANDNTSLVFEIIHKLFEDGPLSKLALTYGYASLISDYCSELNGGTAKVQVGDIERIGNYNFFGTDESGNYYSLASKITAQILGVSDIDGTSPIRIINVADPKNDLDVTNKQYVDRAVKPQKQTFTNGETITVTDNTEYIADGKITNLTIIYPETDFICSFNFTLASEGVIEIVLPDSKYIGSAPTFTNGDTWELNIKNKVVVGGKVE